MLLPRAAVEGSSVVTESSADVAKAPPEPGAVAETEPGTAGDAAEKVQ